MQGSIPFDRFMELALYCPVYGYYEKEGDTVGRRGDYFTNVSVGSLFGELLASQFAEWLRKSPKSQGGRGEQERVQIVEAGAHDGALALDILKWMRYQRPELLERLEYWIVDPSGRRQQRQRKTLDAFSSQVHWAGDLQQLRDALQGSGGVHGIIFCNEFLDAMPVRVGVAVVGAVIVLGLILGARSLNRRPLH